ncbi:glycosyltransferase family protein [Kineococcus sp. SYSU DK001]|uniref:glycosyltransferase family protein n=1 Tax=Kineococcus sp. SYSU DK001 TaxID=3383122 RepID=UPI003D7D567D
MTPSPPRRPRVALYGHDTCGLGHLRRNLALAAALRSGPTAPDVLVLTGSPAAQRFPVPAGVDTLVLPSVRKDADGGYAAGALDVPLDAVVGLRAATLTGALTAWEPDLLVVDKVPRGFGGELEPALDALRRTGRTRTVLGLRDVLDGPAATRAQWHRDRGDEALERWYDEVWVYGDPAVHDLCRDLALPPHLARRTRFTGYLAAGRRTGAPAPSGSHPRTVLAAVGGGVDGAGLTRTLLATELPPGTRLVLLPGPFAQPDVRAELDRAAATRDDLDVVAFTDAFPDWAAQADAVVCMGGYNTVAEVLATGTPALVVPRCRPRREQLVRARAMARRGLLDHARDPGPAELARWIARAVHGDLDHAAARGRCDLDGLGAVQRLGRELLETPTDPTEARRAS